MTTYATPAELAAWIDPDGEDPAVPPNAALLIRYAGNSVDDVVAGALFDVDRATGLAIDDPTALAIKQATLEQASALVGNGIDPRKADGGITPEVASKSLAGMSVSYVAGGAAAMTRAALVAGRLAPAAWGILQRAGLITTSVVTTPRGGLDHWVSDIPFDPTTGILYP